ncbi:MAG: hypothetical protein IJ719_07590 [Clostridia bacterium]|nr:hypothetical protein [Clostridia bacterium]
MQIQFKKISEVLEVAFTALGAVGSVGVMLFGVWHFGLGEAWPELVLNLFYIACLVMVVMYYFAHKLTSMQFNYWSSICVGITIFLRDILFAPPLSIYPIRLICRGLSVVLLLMLTYFYARKEWKTYSKRNLWMICIIDMIIAALYHYDIQLEPVTEYTTYMLTEIWIRPTITYGLVACFVAGKNENNEMAEAK